MLAAFAPPAIVLSIRITLLWPMLADREGSVRSTFTDAILLTRGHALKIAGLLIAFVMLYLLSVTVIESAIGSVLIIVLKTIGVSAFTQPLLVVIVATFHAIYLTFWTVCLACLYARLAGSSRGI
jgi:hypothetical protein